MKTHFRARALSSLWLFRAHRGSHEGSAVGLKDPYKRLWLVRMRILKEAVPAPLASGRSGAMPVQHNPVSIVRALETGSQRPARSLRWARGGRVKGARKSRCPAPATLRQRDVLP